MQAWALPCCWFLAGRVSPHFRSAWPRRLPISVAGVFLALRLLPAWKPSADQEKASTDEWLTEPCLAPLIVRGPACATEKQCAGATIIDLAAARKYAGRER